MLSFSIPLLRLHAVPQMSSLHIKKYVATFLIETLKTNDLLQSDIFSSFFITFLAEENEGQEKQVFQHSTLNQVITGALMCMTFRSVALE